MINGTCIDPPLQSNFDATRYSGRWFEIYRDNGQQAENGYDCQNALYTLRQEGGLEVRNSMFSLTKGDFQSIEGNATCKGAQCDVVFFGHEGDYRVIETDYENYSLVYSCEQFSKEVKFEAAWILSRTPIMAQETQDKLTNLLQTQVPDYDLTFLVQPNQGAQCKYEPANHSPEYLFLQ
ncbi:apolipoprotein d [Stylonychia lemnae]|uniref:Apolipoprotein d n=1 Tax=Stylonychia lemnae TaxID=5949 RepID=A0A078AXP0_STYLE|nr:apolipoprotein d [Stylonychia lemnae]|eukprot:CDW86007.1 apolipoprotein d [Stylonychia lemnae]